MQQSFYWFWHDIVLCILIFCHYDVILAGINVMAEVDVPGHAESW